MDFTAGYLFTQILVLLICSLGLVGNFLCLLVLFRKDMKCSYNYILLGLTFSDGLLLILSFVRTLNNLHHLPILDNYSVGVFIFIWDWICTGGTKYFTVGISLERYFVVCFPIQAHKWITDRRAKLFVIWIFLFVISLALMSYIYHYHLDAPNSFQIYAAVVLHFTPFFAVLVLNLLIYRGLLQFQSQRKHLSSSEASEVSITRMLLVVVLVFGICYSFEFTRRIMNYAGQIDLVKYQYYDYTINHLADIFYVLNSSVNFIIYCLLGKKFRTEFLKILDNTFPCCHFSEGGYRNDSSVSGGISNKLALSPQESKESNLDIVGK